VDHAEAGLRDAGLAKRLFRLVPGAQRAYRDVIYWLLEARAIGFNGRPGLMKLAQRIAKRHMGRQISDPALRAS